MGMKEEDFAARLRGDQLIRDKLDEVITNTAAIHSDLEDIQKACTAIPSWEIPNYANELRQNIVEINTRVDDIQFLLRSWSTTQSDGQSFYGVLRTLVEEMKTLNGFFRALGKPEIPEKVPNETG